MQLLAAVADLKDEFASLSDECAGEALAKEEASSGPVTLMIRGGPGPLS